MCHCAGVVICLKNRTFAVSQTTRRYREWTKCGCDLLEKSYFCSIANNRMRPKIWPQCVVICLKNRTFAVSQTTTPTLSSFPLRLWFAWKIVLLQYRKQPDTLRCLSTASCDLLEKSYFCSIANNQKSVIQNLHLVVICLKNRTFAVSQTTSTDRITCRVGCDLLEKSYFCSIANNGQPCILVVDVVVICLKNRTFAVSQTTNINYTIAHACCDLLEKSYFCSIANNRTPHLRTYPIVVICLKNRTFAVSQTTEWSEMVSKPLLWFAWKIVLLQYRKQHFGRLFCIH